MALLQQHISVRSTEQVKKLLKPLTEVADIHYFCYGINYPDTTGFTLVTDANYYASWFKTEGTLRGFYLGNGWHWVDTMLEGESKLAANSCNIANIVTYIHHQKDKSVILEFGATPNSKNIFEFYMSHRNILKRFGHYFEQEAHELIEDANQNLITPPSHMVKREHPAIQNLSYIDLNSPFEALSTRESQCYKLLIQGYSYEEISKKLSLSANTVNTYFHRIKEKLNCSNKLELIEKARDAGFIEFYL